GRGHPGDHRGRRPGGRDHCCCWSCRPVGRRPRDRCSAAVQPYSDPLLVLCPGGDHSARPASRAPSATAATRPWYLLPPRSNTTESIPAAFARSPTRVPTVRALSDLLLSEPRRSASMVEADAMVLPRPSSTTCTKTWRAERVTTRRGR